MTDKAVLQSIKSTVHSYFPDASVLLFGSRARGNDSTNSDYDILIVTQNAFSPRDKMNWESKISKALVYSLRAPFDVILQSKKEVDLKKDLKGHIVYHALKDAIEI